ncbi:MAG: RNA polymerase sigma factor [Chloroflexi bacterium]|nr:RNA polymerase sigma factor [Chloroflexota bacterium]
MKAAENRENIERQLISRLIQGDPAAVAELVEQYADDVYRFVYHKVGGIAQDAEDVVQETFMAVLKAIHRFRGDSKLRTWMFSIAGHKAADLRRRARRRPEIVSQDAATSLQADDLPPEQAVEHLEVRQRVRQALSQLPPHYSTALILKYVQDMRVREIGQVMKRSEKSVESILVRARRLLSNLLEDEHDRA